MLLASLVQIICLLYVSGHGRSGLAQASDGKATSACFAHTIDKYGDLPFKIAAPLTKDEKQPLLLLILLIILEWYSRGGRALWQTALNEGISAASPSATMYCEAYESITITASPTIDERQHRPMPTKPSDRY